MAPVGVDDFLASATLVTQVFVGMLHRVLVDWASAS